MKADAVGRILLVKAVEETDGGGVLLPLADREQATRDVLRRGEEPGGAAVREESGPRTLRRLGRRAERLFGPLAERYPVFQDLLERSHVPGWASGLVLLLALVCGVGLASLDGTHRINILAFPFLGVIGWNLAVYAAIAGHAVRRLGRPAPRSGRPARWTSRIIARRLSRLVDRTSRVHVQLGEVVSRYAADWAHAAGPMLAARARTLFHLGAASLALGMVTGLYVRGIVFRYDAGWESTFLGPETVRHVLGIVFGPAAAITGLSLPPTAADVAALRWTATGGGGDAALWIHLIAVTLGLYVIAPRLALAVIARLDAWRLQSAHTLPDSLVAYARRTFGAAPAGQGVRDVVVVPYACEITAADRGGLQRWLESSFGRGATLELGSRADYGDESSLRPTLETALSEGALGVVLVMSLVATPESENHGAAIAVARDAARGMRREVEFRVLLDETAFLGRFAGDASLAHRVEERRELWSRFVRAYGVEPEFVDFARSA